MMTNAERREMYREAFDTADRAWWWEDDGYARAHRVLKRLLDACEWVEGMGWKLPLYDFGMVQWANAEALEALGFDGCLCIRYSYSGGVYAASTWLEPHEICNADLEALEALADRLEAMHDVPFLDDVAEEAYERMYLVGEEECDNDFIATYGNEEWWDEVLFRKLAEHEEDGGAVYVSNEQAVVEEMKRRFAA